MNRRSIVLPITLMSAAVTVSAQQPAAGGVTAEQLAKSNNPLSDVSGFNFSNYYDPTLYGLSGVSANTLNLRGVVVSGRQIIRLTVPVSTNPAGRDTVSVPGLGPVFGELPIGPVQYRSGLSDSNIFDIIRLTPEDASVSFGAGPMLVAPTATNSSLGSGKWQAGLSAVVVHPLPGGSLLGALATWQHDFAGDKDRPGTNLATFQPIATFAIGGGYFIKSSAIWVLDFHNNNYLIPVGLGVGKVTRVGSAIVNASFEPQFSVYHRGVALPAVQLVFGLSFQWLKN